MYSCIKTSLVWVCFFAITGAINAQISVVMQPKPASPKVGDTVRIDFVVSNFADVASLQFTNLYDTTKLSYVSITNVTTGLPGFDFNVVFGYPGKDGKGAKGKVSVSWFKDDFTGVNLPNAAVLFTLNLKVIAAGTAQVSWSTAPPGIEVLNSSFTNIGIADPQPITITATGGNTGSTPPTFTIGSATAKSGDQFCVNVTVQNFVQITGVQWTIQYDPAMMDFVSVGNFNLPGLGAAQFGTPTSTTPTQTGTITMVWFDQAASGVALNNGQAMFQLCFKAKGNGGTSSITFATTPTNISVTDKDLKPLAFDGKPGSITVIPVDNNQTGFKVTIANATAMAGDQFCVDVTVQDFTKVLGAQWSISYPAAAMEFVSVGNFNLAGLTAGSFGTPLSSSATQPGQISMVWFDQSVQGVTLANGTAIFQLCFKAKTDGTHTIAFVSTPTAIAVTDVDDKPITFNSQSGSVTISGIATGSGFKLTIADATVNSGEQVCVDVTVRDFINITGVQFSLSYNPDNLEFVSVGNFGLPGLAAGSFGTPLSTTPTQAGQITLVWFDQTVAGVTKTNGQAIFQLCFKAKGAGGTANISFASTPTAISITDVDEQEVPFEGQNGAITINSSTGGSGIFIISAGDLTVQNGADFCVPVKVQGFNGIEGMQFSINYDVQKLTFASIKNLNLANLTMDNFAAPLGSANQTSPGIITLSWNSAGSAGATVPDGTAIFELCFKAAGTGSTLLRFTDTPTKKEIIADSKKIDFNGQNGTVTINGVPAGFAMVIADKVAKTDEEFCLQVKAYDFEQIIGMQYTVTYDPAMLEFKSISKINLAGLSQANFGTPTSAENLTSPGIITLYWFDNSLASVTLADGTVVFEICFKAKGQDGSLTRVEFKGSPTAIEITKVSEEVIPFNGYAGSVTISNVQAPVIAAPAVLQQVTCPGGADGKIDISVTGGTGSFTYKWSHQNATTQDLQNVPAGTYLVTVTDSGSGLSSSASFTVTQPPAFFINPAQITNVNCYGEKTGTIAIAATGGTGSLTFSWNSGLPGGPSQINLAAGQYQFTITDSRACTQASNPIVVSQPLNPLSADPKITEAGCAGSAPGGITLNVSGGTSPYTYDWSGSLPDNVPNQTNLTIGQYTVTITDSKNCRLIPSPMTVTEKKVVVIDKIVPTLIDAGADGAVNIEVSGGMGSNTYMWSGPGGFSSTNQNITGLSQSGEYCVTVTNNGCPTTACTMVVPILKFSKVTINRTCMGETNGRIKLEISGGLPPYQYKWADNFTTNEITDLPVGSYNVEVTDALNNKINGSFEVSSHPLIQITESITLVKDNLNNKNGAIQLTITGGKPDFVVKWDTGAEGAALANIGTGEYCVTVTDANQCSVEDCYLVEFQPAPLASSFTAVPTTCPGDTDGQVTVNVVGGWAPYTLTYGNNQQLNNETGIFEFKNLPAGALSYSVKDARDGYIEGVASVTSPAPISIDNVNILHDNEEAGCSGRITLGIAGGNPNYSVAWNAPTLTGPQVINLCEGVYTPTVTDSKGCTMSFQPITLNTFKVAGEPKGADCPGEATGTVSLQVSGGSGTYQYAWRNAAGKVISEVKDVTGLPAGSYTVEVQESSGNTLVRSFQIETRSQLEISTKVLSNFNGYPVSCPSGKDGVAEASAINGIGMVSYEWTLDNVLVGSKAKAENLQPGLYMVAAIDELGCRMETEMELTAPDELLIESNQRNISCPGEKDGEIIVAAKGGIANKLYNYQWSNNFSGSRITFLNAGSYTVTVTDANGCVATKTFDMANPSLLSVNVETTPADNGCNGTATAIVNGGTEPYDFKWSLSQTKNTQFLTDLCPGEYFVTVTDANGCGVPDLIISARVLDRRNPCLDNRSIITPDGDGLNENFTINCIEELTDNHLQIFNRWGQLVYDARNYDNAWKGTSEKGEKLPDGAYYFILEYTDNEGKRAQHKGSLTLLREKF